MTDVMSDRGRVSLESDKSARGKTIRHKVYIRIFLQRENRHARNLAKTVERTR